MEQRMAKKLTACILSVSMVFGGMAAWRQACQRKRRRLQKSLSQ